MRPLLDRIHNREIDPSFVISHQLPLDEAPRAYEMSGTRRTTAPRSA
ncbi:MAG TPA: hypothetical protein VIJ05_03045 [Actinomycetes bacterium]